MLSGFVVLLKLDYQVVCFIIIFIYCDWVVTWWQWLFYM